jgi:hypothetical protein
MTELFALSIVMPDRCRNCESEVVLVCQAPFPDRYRLRCDACDCSRGIVGTDLRARLEAHVSRYGRQPTRPIFCEPEQPGGDAASETAINLKPKGKTKMRMNELFPSRYLRAADLTKPRVVTIKGVGHETFKDDGVDVTKAVLSFDGGVAPLVVNKTNFAALVNITGYDDDEQWVGQEIELRSQKVMGPGGKVVDSVRVYEVA